MNEHRVLARTLAATDLGRAPAHDDATPVLRAKNVVVVVVVFVVIVAFVVVVVVASDENVVERGVRRCDDGLLRDNTQVRVDVVGLWLTAGATAIEVVAAVVKRKRVGLRRERGSVRRR